ncbi:MAG: hypothetical protein WDM90_12610 [Ferruginibacter sp.]
MDGCVSGLVPDASSNANNAMPKNLTGSCLFTLPPPPTIPNSNSIINVQKAEYYYDTDPGFGLGTDLPVTQPGLPDLTLTNTPTDLYALTPGAHRIYVRTKDAAGNWSITNNKAFFILPPAVTIPSVSAATTVVKAEYYFDTDPGFGNGTDMAVSGTVAIDVSTLISGVHYLYIRTKDAAGNWGLTNVKSFYKLSTITTIPSNATPAPIVKAEYYLDTDPGFGNGHDIAVTTGNDITLSNAFIDITGLAQWCTSCFCKNKRCQWQLGYYQ